MRYVIIGNSYAGIGAIEAIREVDREGEIIVISDEPYRAYARPLISYFLAGRVKTENMYYRDADFYKRHNLKVFLRSKVVDIDTKEKRMIKDNGYIIEYDRLLIGTGGKPSFQQIKGIDVKNVFSFTKWYDAKRLREIARIKRKAIILGGGLIGIKAAEGLNTIGVDVTIVISSPRVLSLVLDEIAGEIINRHIIKSGIRLITGHSAKEIISDLKGKICSVILDDNRKLDCAILVVAKGVRPNIDFIKNTPIHINRGIVVDRCMRTSIDNIYAAGDVAEAWDLLNNTNSVIAIAPLAYEQGRVAGYNMAGSNRLYPGGIGMNSIEVSGLPVMTMGISNKINSNMEVKAFQKGRLYRKLVFKGNRLVGAILLGDIRYGGVLTNLIRNQVDVKDIKKELIDYGLKTGEFVSFQPELC